MPNVKHVRSGWHLGRTNYCGPFTDLNKEREVIDEVDRCCKTHDEEYSKSISEISTDKADKNLIDCVGKYHPIGIGIGIKRKVDELTNNWSDGILRAPNDMSKRGQQAWRINQYYNNKKRKTQSDANERPAQEQAGPSSSGGPDNMGDQDHDMEPPGEPVGASEGGGGGGGGGAGGGDGENVTADEPMGRQANRGTSIFRKSFVIYIDNGIAGSNWTQTAGTTTSPPQVTWNDGWHIIPYGALPASITPHEWTMLSIKASKFRVKSTSFTIDSIIPFQEVLVGGGTTRQAITSFSNRPSLLYYKDDGKTLPQIRNVGLGEFAHNQQWTAARTNYTQGLLKQPTFTFHNWNTARMGLNTTQLPAPTEPNRIFNLEGTGNVRSLYPGGKVSETWINPSHTWHSTRPDTDPGYQVRGRPGATALGFEQETNYIYSHAYWSGVGDRGNLNFDQQFNGIYNSQYRDTGLQKKLTGPPYCLIKMEPYFGSDDNPMQIFAQAHVHYTSVVEWEDLPNAVGQYGAFVDFEQLVDTTNVNAFSGVVLNATAGAAMGNATTKGTGNIYNSFSYT